MKSRIILGMFVFALLFSSSSYNRKAKPGNTLPHKPYVIVRGVTNA